MPTESSYPAKSPLPHCSYIHGFRLDIYRIDAPHHTTRRSALGLIALGIAVLTFIFLTRHRSHACFTRFLGLSIVAGSIEHSILLAYVYNPARLSYAPTGKILFFKFSHRYCDAMMHTIVYEGIGSRRDWVTKGLGHEGIGSRHAKTHHHLPCRTCHEPQLCLTRYRYALSDPLRRAFSILMITEKWVP
jgi:hypothetical protein